MKCQIDNCTTKTHARGWCKLHYVRWRSTGDPLKVHQRGLPLRQRFRVKWEPDPWSGCWTWIGWMDRYGYGRFSIGGTAHGAHRVSYRLHVGPIPDGLTIDHLCRNRACVNPEHLEAVTMAENNRRAREAAR